MYYNKEHLGDRTSRMEKAVQLLLKAIETDPNSGAAWYLIGRLVFVLFCFSSNLLTCFSTYKHYGLQRYSIFHNVK